MVSPVGVGDGDDFFDFHRIFRRSFPYIRQRPGACLLRLFRLRLFAAKNPGDMILMYLVQLGIRRKSPYTITVLARSMCRSGIAYPI